MKNTQNVTIVLLLVTAVILSAMVIGSLPKAQATGTTADHKGNYIVLPAQQWTGGSDLIWVINIATKKMGYYIANPNTDKLERGRPIDLAREFATIN